MNFIFKKYFMCFIEEKVSFALSEENQQIKE